MNNYIPAAQTFNCTHGRINDFFLRLEKNLESDQWTWHMVYAGSSNVCPDSLKEVITSQLDYPNAALCKNAAVEESQRLSDLAFNEYLKNKD